MPKAKRFKRLEHRTELNAEALLTVLATAVNPCLHLLYWRHQVVMYHREILELWKHLKAHQSVATFLPRHHM